MLIPKNLKRSSGLRTEPYEDTIIIKVKKGVRGHVLNYTRVRLFIKRY